MTAISAGHLCCFREMESDYDRHSWFCGEFGPLSSSRLSVVIIVFILLALWLIQFLVNRLGGGRKLKFEKAESLQSI